MIKTNFFNLTRVSPKKTIQILKCYFSNFPTLNNSNNFEDDWFKKLTNSPSSKKLSDSKNYKKFSELNLEEKKQVINDVWHFRRENGLPTPKELNERVLTQLEKCESFTHLGNSMVHMVKEEYYAFLKEQKRQEREKREKKNTDTDNLSEVITNYPGRDTYLKRINNTELRRFYRSKVLSSILNDEPSIVFDFRFTSMHTRIEHIKSLYRQYINIISYNRTSEIPFQVHFCNYDFDTEFHKQYGISLEYDTNLIFETPKNYLDIFPKNKLVYLSRDAKYKMTKYDPDKVYIVGSIIDVGDDRFKFCSYSQAKKDGIRCERLPLDDHVKWNRGQKSLNMDHLFKIFLCLKQGMSWRQAFEKSLPSRKLNEFSDINQKNKIKF